MSILRDRRILIVEDEYLIAASLQENLELAGCVVVGPVPTIEQALEVIESNSRLDAAVVDVNLGGRLAYPVADILQARNIPFIFTSGYEDTFLHSRYPQAKNCAKPYLFPTMEKALVDAIGRKEDRTTTA
jgi:CheY-like chemotaxis protein